MKRSLPKPQGFTLIELMVTLAIAAVLMTIAVPSFSAFKRNAELTSAANTLLSAMNTARSEAMKRNLNAMVAPISGDDWAVGWHVFVDSDRSGGYSPGDVMITSNQALPSYFTVTGTGNAKLSPPYVLFNGSGYASSTSGTLGNLTLTITRNDMAAGADKNAQTRRVVLSNTGRVRVCTATDTVNCKTSSTD